MTTVKITELANIGANLATSTVVPVVNMVGTPTTQKTTVGGIANLILEGAGVDYPEATVALLAQTVSNAAQPNITSIGTLTNVVVSGNASVNGNITSNGTAYLGNISTTGDASITTLQVGASANLGAVGNVTITGGTAGQVLSTDGAGNLSWASDATTYGNSNVVTLLSAFGSNTITTAGNVSVGNIIGNGQALTNIAGANVSGFVPNANVANTAFAVAAANVSGLGNIATLNLDGNASNVLRGDGTFGADANSSYGDSNVTSLLGAFGSNTISTTGIITADGANLSNVPYANLTGSPSLGNISTINLDGNVSNLLTGNGTYVAIPVVPTVGNIATLNLTGSNTNVLYGNGVFAAVAGGANTGNVTFSNQIVIGTGGNDGTGGLYLASGPDGVANTQYLRVRGGDNFSHIHLDTSNSQAYDQYFGNDAKYVKLELGDAGNVVVGTDDAAGNSYNWTFTSGGNFILANGNSVIQSIANSSLDPTLPNVSTMTLTPDQNYNSQALVLDPTAPGHIHLRAYAFSNIDDPAANIFLGGEDTAFEVTSGANNEVRVHSGGNTWTFDNTGNLTFPRDAVGNIDPILSIVSGATPTIVSTAASLTGPANLAIQSNYLNLSGFTGEKITFFPDDGLIATDYDMVLTTNVGGGNTYTWTLDATGNLNLPGNLIIAGNANVFGTNRALIQPANDLPLIALSSGANGAVSSVWVEDIGNVGTSNIAAVYANPTSGSGIVRIAVGQNGVGSGPNLWDFNANGTLTFPGTPRIDTSTNNFEVQAAEAINFEANTVVNIYTDTSNNAFQWQFGDDGNLTLPDTTSVLANVNITLEANDTGNITGLNLIGDSNANLYAHGNVKIVSDSSNTTATWTFGADGNLTIPGTSGGFIKTASNASIGIVAMDNGTNNPAQLLSINVGNGNATSIISAYATNATIQTNASGNINTWQFDNAGNLTLPTGGQIIVSGGLVSSGASPAPTINGFSITNSVGISGNGNIAGNNISATGNVSGNFFLGNGSQLTGITATSLVNGTSNVVTTNNGNVTIGIAGNAAIATFTGTGANVTGTLDVTGNVTAQGVGTNLVRRANTISGSNTAVTLDNLNAYVGGTPKRLYIGAATSNMTMAGQSQTMSTGALAVSSWINVPIVTGTGNGFAMSGAITNDGDTAVLNVTDQGAGSGTWRVTGMIANTSANLYSVSIERLA